MASEATIGDSNSAAGLAATLARLRAAQRSSVPGLAQRRADLKRLRATLKARFGEMSAAISADFGHRPEVESLLADGASTLSEIDHLLAHLRQWMRPEPRPVGWRLWPARAEIHYQPIGVVGVISPWNYPVYLALVPIATAIAAGCHVMLKPSEHTPATSKFLKALLAEVFPADRVAVVTGDTDVAKAFSALAFDHLLFTGSTEVGRQVMAAAAKNLVPVTLELGGKSPAIIGSDYPIGAAARSIATGKWLNAGQTCIAPDYVLVPKARVESLVAALRTEAQDRYASHPTDLATIVNADQHVRLTGLRDAALAAGAKVETLVEGVEAPDKRRIAPTVIIDPGPDSPLMAEELFGPLLPIVPYDRLEDAIDFITARPRPLALYHFEHDSARVAKVQAGTVAGGVTVNDTLLQISASELPFGGVGASGMGAYHGHVGFLAFCKAKPIVYQARWSAAGLVRPPYSGIAGRIVRLLAR